MKYDKPPRIYVDVFDKWKRKPKRKDNGELNGSEEKYANELRSEFNEKLLTTIEEIKRLMEMVESKVIAVCEFILTKIHDDEGMYVFTLFNKSNQKYMDSLEIEPVGKFIRYGENGLLSEDNSRIYSLDDIASFIQELFLYIYHIEKEKKLLNEYYSDADEEEVGCKIQRYVATLEQPTCSVRGLNIFSGYYILNGKKSLYANFPNVYHTKIGEKFGLKKAALRRIVKEYIIKELVFV